ncbi:MAG: hypothetical protein ABIJ15_01140 [bacterium]
MKLKNLIKNFFLVTLLPFYFVASLWAWDDGFTITLTPVGARGVVVDDSGVNLNLGDIAVGGSTRTLSAINVISTGSISNIEYNIKGSVSGAVPAALSTDLTIENAELLLQVKFNTVDPDGTANDYVATDIVDAVAEHAGSLGGDNAFEGDEDVDNLTNEPHETRHLWCRVEIPQVANFGGEQSITVTITAEAGE